LTVDAVLGPPYTTRTLQLTPDEEGEVVATLVSRPAPEPTGRAVLYVHGYVDYFFHDHVAQFWIDEGYDFYAIDLRKYGRSIRPHQTPNYCTDLTEFDEDLDEAVRVIRDENGHTTLVVMAHSMGGLVTSLWAHRRGPESGVDALVLNSPWFGHNGPWIERTELVGRTIEAVGKRRARTVLPMKISVHQGHSLHRDYRGEWNYNLDWKPVAGFPATAGFGRAIRRGQTAVARGLDLACPVLVACSARSVRSSRWTDEFMRVDLLLNVDDMVRHGARLGRHVTIVRIEGGMHDLALSRDEPRQRYFAEVRRWTRAYVPPAGRAASRPDHPST
jgi:alpha-beta hydrolase superfamily lysophospholipase